MQKSEMCPIWVGIVSPGKDVRLRLLLVGSFVTADDLRNQNRTRGLWKMSTADEMAEFISLRGLLQDVQLCNVSDTITWRWNAQGIYTAESAYAIQFKGSYCTFNAKGSWRWNAQGIYTAESAYAIQFKGSYCTFNAKGSCLVCYFSSFPLSLHHIKYTKRHMIRILNVDEIKN
jgi:hypothetical protein